MFRILSLAGGGLRGAFAVGLLSEFEQRLDRPLWDYFDLIAGTSTGAITASALCQGTTALEVKAFYQKHSTRIFHPREPFCPRNHFRHVYPLVRRFLGWRGPNPDHFFQSRYCPFSLTAALEEGFGSTTLREVRNCRLVVPTVNLTDGVIHVFRTPHLPGEDPSYDWPVTDVIVAAAAAPTFFPHKRMPDGKDHADGGLWAIDPGVVALAEAVRITEQCSRKEDPRFDLHKVAMLSVGTGQAGYSLSPPGADAGMLFWSRHVAEVMTNSQVQGTQLPLKIVLGDRYQQIDFELEDPAWTIDNVDMPPALFDLGRRHGAKLFDEVRDAFFGQPTERFSPFLT